MPFDVGAIVARLQMDTKGWTQSVAGVQADQKRIGGMSEQMAGKFKTAGKVMTGVGLGIIGTLGGLAKSTANAGEELLRMSVKTGISVETLSEWRLAVSDSDTNMESLATGLRVLSGNMADAANGNQAAIDKFDAMGISVKNADGTLRSLDDITLDMADHFAGMEDGAAKLALAQDVLGRSGGDLIPLFNMGREGMKASREEAQRLGMTMSRETAVASDEFNDSLGKLKLSVGALATNLIQQLMPSITKLVEGITNIVGKMTAWVQAHPDLVRQIGEVLARVGGLLLALGPLVMIVPKIVAGIGAIGKAFTFLAANPMVLVVAGLAALGLALNSVIEKMKKAHDAAMDAMVADKSLSESFYFRRQILKDGIVTQDEMTDALKRFGWGTKDVLVLAKAAHDTHQTGTGVLGRLAKAYEEHEKVLEQNKKTLLGINPVLEQNLEKTAAWIDYIHSMGLGTIQEKSARVKELEGIIKKLDEALAAGKIDLATWTAGVKKAKDEAAGLGPILLQQVPAARDFSDLMAEAPTLFTLAYSDAAHEVPIITGEMTDAMSRKLSDGEEAWSNFAQTVGGKIGDIFLEMVKLPKFIDDMVSTWPPALEGLFKTVYEAFSTFVADLIAKWVVEFLIKNLIGETATAAAAAASSLVGLGTSVLETTADVAGAAAQTATGAITGVATGAINMISGIVTAAASVLALFKKADYSSITYWLKPIQERTQEIRDYLFLVLEGQHLGFMHDLMVDDNKCLWDLIYKAQWIGDTLADSNAKLQGILDKTGGAQHGARVDRPSLMALVEGRPAVPEWVIPEPELKGALAAGGGRPNMQVTMQNTFNISGDASGAGVRDQVRQEIIPAILDSLDVNYMKELWRQKLGVV